MYGNMWTHQANNIVRKIAHLAFIRRMFQVIQHVSMNALILALPMILKITTNLMGWKNTATMAKRAVLMAIMVIPVQVPV